MNHDFHVRVRGYTQLNILKQAIAEANEFYGEGNWREDSPASVVKIDSLYVGDYYFTDAPETYGYSTTLFNEIEE